MHLTQSAAASTTIIPTCSAHTWTLRVATTKVDRKRTMRIFTRVRWGSISHSGLQAQGEDDAMYEQ